MSDRISLIIILLICYNGETARATVDWALGTCEINLPETTPKESLYIFTAATGGTSAYSLKSQTGKFVIAPNGTLSSKTQLDYDSGEKIYSLQITRNNTDKALNTNITCVINVTDVNDNPPTFAPTTYSVDTDNNVAINTTLLTVTATDRDVSEAFNKVVYSIKVGEDGVNFTINGATGGIRAKTVLNAAVPSNLTLKVVATDNDDAKFTAEASVRVCVGCKTSGSSSPKISLFVYAVLIFGVVLV